MRDWWLRLLLVLQAPRPVFAALREGDADDRAEPVLLVVSVVGIALAAHASTDLGGLEFAAWALLAGLLTGAVVYWFFGAVLFVAARALGSEGTYRRARHVLAFACVPLALALLLWPTPDALFRWGTVALALWSAALLVLGVRAVHGWSWPRAVAAAAAPIAVGALALALG